MKYAYIQKHSVQWNVSVLCELLEVSTSGYHDFTVRPVVDDETRVVTEIRAHHARSRSAYGWPRIWRSLQGPGIAIGKECTRCLMQKHGIRGRQKRQFVRTTQRDYQDPVASNVLDRDFNPSWLNQAWAGDITYIPTAEGWLFLAIVLDLASRKIAGYALADHMRSELAIEALKRAALGRKPVAGILFHSDQGSQYTSTAFRAASTSFGGKASMSRRGNCWDNAPSESCFGSLKMERVYGAKYETREQAKTDVLDWLCWYNAERLHSSLGYRSPTRFEAEMSQKQKQTKTKQKQQRQKQQNTNSFDQGAWWIVGQSGHGQDWRFAWTACGQAKSA